MKSLLTAILAILVTGNAFAGEVAWKMHTINAQSEFPACAAFDVDHDGDIDIFSGGWWYEAPTWKKHKVRDVEIIRGRFDDYSNQPMDCNGDGWIDIISVNYRSETIYWIEHPGKNLGKQDWVAHVIDKPGPSETGRLHDIDGDGDLDILPNGTKFAAWYEYAPQKKEDGTLEPKWVKHDLPKEVAGHGIGFRRGKLPFLRDMPDEVGAEVFTPNEVVYQIGSQDGFQRVGEQFRPRSIHQDASVPILVDDSIHPKSSLFVWGRGHRTGLYWKPRSFGTLGYANLAVDTSWSQCHAPLLADIDMDGKLDVVAGKRYMGHEGKDPGEYDPLVIYWYKATLNEASHVSWTRHVVQEAGPAGMDLDPKAADIDGDGDIDLIAPSRHGLYLFENLLVNSKNAAPTIFDSKQAAAAYQDHSQLLVYATDDGDLHPVKTPLDWSRRRWHILRNMEAVMGELPTSRRAPPRNWQGKGIVDRKEDAYYTIHAFHHGTPFTMMVPKGRGRMPAILCLHPTSIPHGKKIVTGEIEAPNRHYALELVKRGYVCICPDYPTMGEHEFELGSEGNSFQSGTMKAVWDNIACLDVLEHHSYVDPDRIGVIGHSLGGHNGMFTACFDQRIKCVVTSCGFTPFHDYYGGDLKGWTQDRYMPRIRDVYDSDPDKVPFDFYEVLGALAPRPVFINAPLKDDNFDVGGVKKAVTEAQKVYDLLGQPKNLVSRHPDCEHDFPPEIREEVYDWLDKQLK